MSTTDLKLLIWPDVQLMTPSRAVNLDDPQDVNEAMDLAIRMADLMKKKDGLGLSAIQVGVGIRMFVSSGPPPIGPRAFINPSWRPASDHTEDVKEGCLSTPGVFQVVSRYPSIHARWFNPKQKSETQSGWMEATMWGLHAQVFQHECEHLDGRMFLDHLAPTRVKTIRRKMERLKAGG